jgi:signal transduction histidine kinase/DNA-binding response OmpR family regulator/ligand-binding sensor domain-containing protein
MRKILPVATLILLFISALHAENRFVFRNLNLYDGLSDNQIRNLIELPDGRIGIKTMFNFNIYNGAGFDLFYHDAKKAYHWKYNLPPATCLDEQDRVWIKNPRSLLLLDLNTNCYDYDIAGELQSFGVDGRLIDVLIDNAKNYWFITEDSTVSLYDVHKKELTVITEGQSDFTRLYGIPRALCQHKNLVWIVYSKGLIRCRDYASSDFIIQDTSFCHRITPNTDRIFIRPTATGDIWLMYNSAIYYNSRTNNSWTKVTGIAGASNFFTCMDLDRDGNVWAGTSWSGLRYIDGRTFHVNAMNELPVENGVIRSDIHSIVVDENNGVWIGTMFQGVCYYHASMNKVQLFQTAEATGGLSNEFVRCFLEEADGNILVGTNSGLFRFHPDSHRFEKLFKGQIEDICLTLYRDSRKNIWIGTWLNGFCRIENGGRIRKYKLTGDPNNNVGRAIYEDSSGRYWVSVYNNGVGRLDPETGEIRFLSEKFHRLKFHTLDYRFCPVKDNGNYFAVLGESGIYFYDSQADTVWIPEVDSPNSPKFRDAHPEYYCILKDSRSLEWYGTERGIWIWDEARRQRYIIDINNGLPNNSVSAMLEDSSQAVYVSTPNGISKITAEENTAGYTFHLVNFNHPKSLQIGKIYNQQALKASNGDFYFGGIHGFYRFNPQKTVYNNSRMKPIFTALKLFNTTVRENTPRNDRILLDKPINKTREIRLRYNENHITLEFAGLNYVNPKQTYFRYKLENFDNQWTEIAVDGQGSVTYTKLTPGTYHFKVYTANNDKLWSDRHAELRIIISPPIWGTVYANILYALLAGLFIYSAVRYFLKKNRLKIEQQKILDSEKQKQELDQMKFRFFTNISHEFRTPLTLIMTPLNTLIQQQTDGQLKQKLTSIYRNAENMLLLINQLLDFRKLEMGGERINRSNEDFIGFVRHIYLSFKDTAENKSINFTFYSEIKTLVIGFDKSKIHKIINNLYSNALKFTPAGGFVSTILSIVEQAGCEYVKIEVADTGCGIAPDELQTVFRRFYQSKNIEPDKAGSGIGLHLAKEYAELHGGKITVGSKLNQGSLFTVFIPTNLPENPPTENPPTENPATAEEKLATLSAHATNKKLLIVEDNTEFRNFLAEQLDERFLVVQAGDGQQGEAIALKESPDLIVSDLMMPVVDGLEMCNRLKNNIETSHIPIILLTARLSDEAKIESYKAGADSYIAKPFNFEVLLTRIEMLIEQQEKRRKLFHKTIEITPSTITTTSLDEAFVKKALQTIDRNIGNIDYSVDNFSSDMALSRSQLYRKLESIMGLSPNEFISSIRLKRAAQLLKDSRYNISEISDRCGFNTIRNFNRIFKDEFGLTPTQYRIEHKA